MRVEDRTGVMTSLQDCEKPQIILICEDEAESHLVDKLGKPGDRVSGSLQLADGYGEFYIRLERHVTPKPTEFTRKVREYIIRKTAVEGVESVGEFLTEYGMYMTEALELIDNQTAIIEEVIELMDEEPAKEILKKAVGK